MWNSDGAYWHIPYSSSCSSSSSSFFFFFCDRVSKKEGAGGHTVQASPARHQGNYWGPVLRDSVWGGGLAGRGRGLETAGARVLPQGDDQGQSREPSYPAQCCVLVYSTECISWCYTLYLHVGTPLKCRQLPNTQACCVILWSEPFLLPCIFVHAPDWQSFYEKLLNELQSCAVRGVMLVWDPRHLTFMLLLCVRMKELREIQSAVFCFTCTCLLFRFQCSHVEGTNRNEAT